MYIDRNKKVYIEGINVSLAIDLQLLYPPHSQSSHLVSKCREERLGEWRGHFCESGFDQEA